jgi:DNA-binding response OmpR family regulator
VTAPGGQVILAVEDEHRNAALLRAILQPAGYELHVVASLAEGRSWLADHAADLLLLDRHLPDGDSLELVRELRARPGGAAQRVLVVSASVLPRDWEAAAEAGCDAFVPKPISVKGLLAEIRRQLER